MAHLLVRGIDWKACRTSGRTLISSGFKIPAEHRTYLIDTNAISEIREGLGANEGVRKLIERASSS